jgi:hypothetical protein
MSELIDEVNDDLRRKELEKFWKENGAWIVGCMVLAVVFTAVMSWWREHTYQRNMHETAQMIQVIKNADVDKMMAFAASTDKDHAVVARFAAAAVYAKRDESDKAISIYADIANTTGVDATYRDLARLLSVGQRLTAGDPAALHKDLSELTKPGATWRFSALELEALLYARENKMKEAADDLAEIAGDSSAPQDLRMRASTLREFYVGSTPDASKKGKS